MIWVVNVVTLYLLVNSIHHGMGTVKAAQHQLWAERRPKRPRCWSRAYWRKRRCAGAALKHPNCAMTALLFLEISGWLWVPNNWWFGTMTVFSWLRRGSLHQRTIPELTLCPRTSQLCLLKVPGWRRCTRASGIANLCFWHHQCRFPVVFIIVVQSKFYVATHCTHTEILSFWYSK